MPGFRTMFSAFHHLRPDQARAALADAVAHKEGIAIFEPSERNILLLLPVLGTPIRALLLVPFFRPFRWSNLLWTYLIPVFPFVILFDVVVSFLRIYSRAELTALTAGLDGYDWTTGTVRGGRFPLPILYLIGEPRRP